MYRAIGVAALALAGAGAVLPVLPSTVFVLIAAWAFARSSPRLHQALLEHPRFGPLLSDWERHGAIPRRAKLVAVSCMAISWILIVAAAPHWLAPTLAGVILLLSAIYVATRPEPPPSPPQTDPATRPEG